jgi:hypothetical protein
MTATPSTTEPSTTPTTDSTQDDETVGAKTPRAVVCRPWPWLPLWIEVAPHARLVVVRVLVCLFATGWILARTPAIWAPALGLSATRHWAPVGLLSPLQAAPPIALVILVQAVGLAAGVLATMGRWIRWSLPILAIVFLLLATLRSSVGMIFHTENLTALHLLVLAAHARRTVDDTSDTRPAHERTHDTTAVLTTLSLVTLAAYLVAGLAKLHSAGIGWADGALLRDQVAWDNLRKLALGDVGSPFVGPLLRLDGLWPLLAAISLLVEIGAPLAFAHPRLLRLWALAAWGFHVGVLALMAIVFPYPLLGLAYVSMLPCERLVPWVRARWTKAPVPRPGTYGA